MSWSKRHQASLESSRRWRCRRSRRPRHQARAAQNFARPQTNAPDPWKELAEKYPIGTVVTGRVRNLTDFGAFIEIEEGFDGLIHVSDISWAGRVKNPPQAFKKGDTVTAKVLKIDAEIAAFLSA